MLKNLLVVAHALSDPTRLRIVKLLAMRELCVCQLQYLLGASQSRVSQNLTILKYADLVTDTRRGRLVFYSLNRPAFEKAIADLRALINAPHLDGVPEMSDEMKRWKEFPADLEALCPVAEAQMDGDPVSEVVDVQAAGRVREEWQ